MRFATLLVLISTAALTAGCVTTAPRPIRSDCDWAEPIRPSREDVLTDGTLAQIVAHNEVGERICGWRP